MKHMTATGALTGELLSLSKLLPVYLVDRLYLSVAVMDDKLYCLFGRVQGGHRKLIAMCGKLAAVSHGIWKNFPQKIN